MPNKKNLKQQLLHQRIVRFPNRKQVVIFKTNQSFVAVNAFLKQKLKTRPRAPRRLFVKSHHHFRAQQCCLQSRAVRDRARSRSLSNVLVKQIIFCLNSFCRFSKLFATRCFIDNQSNT